MDEQRLLRRIRRLIRHMRQERCHRRLASLIERILLRGY